MDDEIERINRGETLLFISVRIGGPPPQPDQRFGMLAYRDRGDEFVNTDLRLPEGQLKSSQTPSGKCGRISAATTPESLNEAPHVTVHEPEWRP